MTSSSSSREFYPMMESMQVLTYSKMGLRRQAAVNKEIWTDKKKVKQQNSVESEEGTTASTSWTDEHSDLTATTELAQSRRPSDDKDQSVNGVDQIETTSSSPLPLSWRDFMSSPYDKDDDNEADDDDEDDDEDGQSEDWIKKEDLMGTRGLICLQSLDRLIIRHHVELLQIFMGCEKKNQFEICAAAPTPKNKMVAAASDDNDEDKWEDEGSQNQAIKMFAGREETDFCTRLCLPSNLRPPFDIVIQDRVGSQVISLSRNTCTCGPLCCCLPCCLQTMDVYGGGGTHFPATFFLGRIEQKCSLLRPKFRILNERSEPVLKIRGRQWLPSTLFCFSDVHFDILAPVCDPDESDYDFDPKGGHADNVVVGKISRKWPGFFSQQDGTCGRDGDNFDLNFPRDLDVKLKAVLIGACILIDLIYFEDSTAQHEIPGVGARGSGRKAKRE